MRSAGRSTGARCERCARHLQAGAAAAPCGARLAALAAIARALWASRAARARARRAAARARGERAFGPRGRRLSGRPQGPGRGRTPWSACRRGERGRGRADQRQGQAPPAPPPAPRDRRCGRARPRARRPRGDHRPLRRRAPCGRRAARGDRGPVRAQVRRWLRDRGGRAPGGVRSRSGGGGRSVSERRPGAADGDASRGRSSRASTAGRR